MGGRRHSTLIAPLSPTMLYFITGVKRDISSFCYVTAFLSLIKSLSVLRTRICRTSRKPSQKLRGPAGDRRFTLPSQKSTGSTANSTLEPVCWNRAVEAPNLFNATGVCRRSPLDRAILDTPLTTGGTALAEALRYNADSSTTARHNGIGYIYASGAWEADRKSALAISILHLSRTNRRPCPALVLLPACIHMGTQQWSLPRSHFSMALGSSAPFRLGQVLLCERVQH
ncbi:hypothetical protein F4780DRAFT_66365 [Xylariomycetidae sp. FL0641]|nr:hypothetical protein F4780DRAFT_66365 [Xylariomycetidae sp. FL0641]